MSFMMRSLVTLLGLLALLWLAAFAPRAHASELLQLSAHPVLTYSRDINGGSPDKPIYVMGLPFRLPEDQVQKSGVLTGAGVSAGGQFDPLRSVRLNYAATLEAMRNPAYGLNVGRANLRVCALGFPLPRNLLTFCALRAVELKDLKTSRRSDFELALAHRKALGRGAIFSDRVAIGRAHIDNYWQDRISARIGVEYSGGRSISLASTYFERVSGVMAQRAEIEASYGMRIAGRSVFGTLTLGRSAGGQFLGVDRVDRTRRLAVTVQATTHIGLALGYSQVNSSADYYDQNGWDVSFKLMNLSF